MREPSPGRTAEAAVVALAIAGDDRAFGELVTRRQTWLFGLMLRLCGDPSLADDLSQQAFLRAWRTLPSLRSPLAFAAWLRQIALNTWLEHARRGRLATQPLGDLDFEITEADSAERLDLIDALARLKPAERICVVLSYAEGLSHAEIAESVGLPLGTVKSHVARGAGRLRRWLGDRP